MSNQSPDKNKEQSSDKSNENEEKKAPLDPEPETLHKTDPQENMKGPISSIMQNIKDEAEENDVESKEEADEKKDKNT
jgi:hypothetical protein